MVVGQGSNANPDQNPNPKVITRRLRIDYEVTPAGMLWLVKCDRPRGFVLAVVDAVLWKTCTTHKIMV